MLDHAHAQHDVVGGVGAGQGVADVAEIEQMHTRLREQARHPVEGGLIRAIRIDRVNREAGAREHQREVAEIRSVVQHPARHDAPAAQRRGRMHPPRDAAAEIARPVEVGERRRAACERTEIGADDCRGNRLERRARAGQVVRKVRREAFRKVQRELFLNVHHWRRHSPSRTWRVPLPISPAPTTETSNRRDTQEYTDGLIE